MRVIATALVDAATHVALRPPVAESTSWTLVIDGGIRGGEVILMFADPADARRVLAALLDGLPGGEPRECDPRAQRRGTT